ncbi:MAG: hypothetical protein WC785_08990 [Tatlockia sp.]|jgi:hypothetical protein
MIEFLSPETLLKILDSYQAISYKGQNNEQITDILKAIKQVTGVLPLKNNELPNPYGNIGINCYLYLTPLLAAVLTCGPRVIERLITEGAALENSDNYLFFCAVFSLSPLTASILLGKEATARLLIHNKADVNAANIVVTPYYRQDRRQDGHERTRTPLYSWITPLWAAILTESPGLLMELLRHGATLEEEDADLLTIRKEPENFFKNVNSPRETRNTLLQAPFYHRVIEDLLNENSSRYTKLARILYRSPQTKEGFIKNIQSYSRQQPKWASFNAQFKAIHPPQRNDLGINQSKWKHSFCFFLNEEAKAEQFAHKKTQLFQDEKSCTIC